MSVQKILTGKAFVYGPNIDTDQIHPGRFLDLTDPDQVGKHAMEGADPNFVKEVQQGDLIVAATNFGCGSSREHAAVTLKAAGVGAILADSYGRIFYRNAINLGVPLIVCPGISKVVNRGDVIEFNMTTGTVLNKTSGKTLQAQPLSDYVMNILASGGIKPLIKKQMEG